MNMRHDGLLDVVRQLRPVRDNGAFFVPAFAYHSDGLSAVIVDRPAEDALARGFEIEGDPDKIVLNEMDRLNASIHFTDAVRWARLYGASAILMLARDGAPLTAPLNIANLQVVEDLVVYPGDCIEREPDVYSDPTQRNYGLPTHYRLSPEFGNSFVVHESRLIKFSGDPLARHMRAVQRLPFMGRSALDACREDLQNYRDVLRLTKEIVKRKQQAVHSMAGLTELLGTQEGQNLVREKIALTDAVRGVLNSITIDGGPGNGTGDGDKYDIIDLSLGGLDNVLGEFRDALAASTRMPQAILFGADIKGLGSTGKGEQAGYHALLKSIQERCLRPCIEQFAGIIWAQSSVGASEPERWRVEFAPLWSPTEAELAEVELKRAQARKTQMEAVQLGVTAYVLSPEEGREAAGMAFPELELDPGDVPEMPDDDADAAGEPGASGGAGTGAAR